MVATRMTRETRSPGSCICWTSILSCTRLKGSDTVVLEREVAVVVVVVVVVV
jgi:hypothetical protein